MRMLEQVEDLIELWALAWPAAPAVLDQRRDGCRRVVGQRRAQILEADGDGRLEGRPVGEGHFVRNELKEEHPVAEDVGRLGVPLVTGHLRGHPTIGARLCGERVATGLHRAARAVGG